MMSLKRVRTRHMVDSCAGTPFEIEEFPNYVSALDLIQRMSVG